MRQLKLWCVVVEIRLNATNQRAQRQFAIVAEDAEEALGFVKSSVFRDYNEHYERLVKICEIDVEGRLHVVGLLPEGHVAILTSALIDAQEERDKAGALAKLLHGRVLDALAAGDPVLFQDIMEAIKPYEEYLTPEEE